MSTEHQILQELLGYAQDLNETAAAAHYTAELERLVQERLLQQQNDRRLPDLVAYQRDRDLRFARPERLLAKLWKFQCDPFLDIVERCENLSGVILAFLEDIQVDLWAPSYFQEIVGVVQMYAYNPEKLIQMMHSDRYGYAFLKRLQYAIQDKVVVDDDSFFKWAKTRRVAFNPRNFRHWLRVVERISDRLQELPPVKRVGSVDDIEYAPLLPGFSDNPLAAVFAQMQAEQQEAQ